MSTAATRARKLVPRLNLSREKGNEILGLVLWALVALLTGSLISYNPLDPSLLHYVADENAQIYNFIGPIGAEVAALCFSFLGLSALLVPAILALFAWHRLKGAPVEHGAPRLLGAALLVLAVPALLQLALGQVSWRGAELEAGGLVGVVLDDALTSRLNFGGALVVLLAALAIGGSLAVTSTLTELFNALRTQSTALAEHLRLRWAQVRKRRQEEHRRQDIARRLQKRETRPAAIAEPEPAAPPAAKIERPVRVREKQGAPRFAVRRVEVPAPDAASAEMPAGVPTILQSPPPASPPPSPAPGSSPAAGADASRPQASLKPAKAASAEPHQQDLAFRPEEIAPAELPPVNLLRTDNKSQRHDEQELLRLGEIIRQAFEHFGIEGTVEGISPGPVITIFEFQPAPGIKVSRIVNLQDDLALALKAESVRIERIPGRSTLGIEVPNKQRQLIRLGPLLTDDKFNRAPSVLTMVLGVDIHGRPYYADLATMPHLLVAGATGSGKSVGLQSMITSIIYKARREQVQFIFIDPKRIELGVYADIPHLKTAVVVEPKKAANALRWAVAEMERRYRLLAEVHVRSIDYYNRAVTDPKERKRLSLIDGEGEVSADDLKALPYYVIIIDELADLMMVSSSEVEASIARLAQMARAVGIHLIVATQRPSVDVLTGTIKANFPCRLSYATATRHDSRTILDQIGAEKLLGKGDALFVPPGTSRICRIHGAYITEQETAALIRWLKRHGKPDLDLDVLKDPKGEAKKNGEKGGGDDELFEEAARMVVAERQASASFLQRRMRIGFSRASRLIDMMEADGLLGPSQGSKPREVLVKPDFFEEIDRARME